MIDPTDLEEGSFLPRDLNEYGFIFVSGGSTFYLAYRLKKTGLDKKIRDYVTKGGVYLGSSAGAVILMDNIKHFSIIDDATKVPEVYSGLGVVNEAVIPHADSDKYSELIKGVVDLYRSECYEVIPLKDNQVFIIDNEDKVVM